MSNKVDLSKLSDAEQAVLKKLIDQLAPSGLVSESSRQPDEAEIQLEQKMMISRVLKRLRKANGLSQQEVAKRLGVSSQNFISTIENGKAAPPKDKLFRFSFAYDSDMLLNFALMKYACPDLWSIWLDAQVLLTERGWPDPYGFEHEVDNWVGEQLK